MTVDDVAWNDSRWSELAPGVHQRSFASWNLNVGVVVGEEKALVVDTRSTPREGRELLAHVRELTDLELLVVNTHAHPDHCSGNEAFAGSRVLAHPVALEAMRSGRFARRPAPVAHRPSPVASPQDQVSTSRLLDLGGRRVAVHFHGRGHTDGDVVVEVLGSGVTFAGDLIRQDRAPWYGDAFPLQWPATVAHMLVLGVDAHTWVPGHGRPMSTREVRVQAAELDEVAQVVTEAWYAGVDEAEAAAELELGPENSRHAATRGYAELAAGHVDRVPST